jgi:two-component system, NtrC family, response regulator AtoC
MRPSLVAPPPPAAEPTAPTAAAAAVTARTMREIERQAILDALSRCAGNQTRAAERLGMPRRTFCAKLKEHDIPRPRTSS